MKQIAGTFLIALSLVPAAAVALQTETTPLESQTVDPALLQTVAEQLPEANAVDSAFLNTDYDPYLTLNQDANVSVTFLDEGAGYNNSLGWLTFNEGAFDGLSKGDIDSDGSGVVSLDELSVIEGVDVGWLYPNVSESGGGGSLLPGDTVQVGDGTLAAGTSVSFFLAQNAWDGGDLVDDAVLSGDTQLFYGLDLLNPEADFTSTVDSNLVDARHVAMLFADASQEQVIMGFEDLNRIDSTSNDYGYRSDEDFNDAVFIINSDPAGAFGDSNIATAPVPPLGGGLLGLLLLAGLTRLPKRT